MKVKVQKIDGKASGDIELNDDVFGIEPRADILHRGETGQQGLVGKACAIEGGIHIRVLEGLDPLIRPVLAGDVNMAVDQARQDIGFLEINQLGAARRRAD